MTLASAENSHFVLFRVIRVIRDRFLGDIKLSTDNTKHTKALVPILINLTLLIPLLFNPFKSWPKIKVFSSLD